MKFRYNEKRLSTIVPCGTVLQKVISEMGLLEEIVIALLKEKWKEIVGEIIATHSYPLKLQGDVLCIAVDHSIYANEIMLSQQYILNLLSNYCGTVGVTRLKCITYPTKGRRKRSNVHTRRG